MQRTEGPRAMSEAHVRLASHAIAEARPIGDASPNARPGRGPGTQPRTESGVSSKKSTRAPEGRRESPHLQRPCRAAEYSANLRPWPALVRQLHQLLDGLKLVRRAIPHPCGAHGSYVPTPHECPSGSFTLNSRLPYSVFSIGRTINAPAACARAYTASASATTT